MEGMLGGISLLEALRALAVLGKSGVLKVAAGDESGDVYFGAGKITGFNGIGEADDDEAREVVISGLVELLENPGGNYEFADSAEITEEAGALKMEVDAVIAAIAGRQEEWRAIRALLPHDSVLIEPVIDQHEDIKLSKDEWRLACHVGSRIVLGELLAVCGSSALEGSRAVADMIHRGLLQVDAEQCESDEVIALAGRKSSRNSISIGKYISGREMGQRMGGDPLMVPEEWSSYYDLLDQQRDLAAVAVAKGTQEAIGA